MIVIPTRFGRPTLPDLIAAASRVAPVVVVHTEPGHDDHPGATNVHDHRRNIHHWWNTGLDACHGPALVLNDDISATPDALAALLAALDTADLAYVPGRRPDARTPISGWCYGIRPDELRPDPAFVWWFGDDDLYRRAATPRLVDTAVTHHQRPDMGPAPEFAQAVKADRALYRQRWPDAR